MTVPSMRTLTLLASGGAAGEKVEAGAAEAGGKAAVEEEACHITFYSCKSWQANE